VTPQSAPQFDLGIDSGVLVQRVVPGSAAAKAGIRPGDAIVGFDGRKLESVEDLYAALRRHKPGDKVTLRVWHAGKESDVDVTLSGRAVG
jgi:S1-C subfamily serine protease